MARSRSHKDEEDLRGKVRELEKINKALRRRLKQLEKNKHVWEQLSLNDEEVEVVETSDIDCPSCGKGVLLPLDLGRVGVYHICSICSHREKSNG